MIMIVLLYQFTFLEEDDKLKPDVDRVKNK
jgi:hypothetical protein